MTAATAAGASRCTAWPARHDRDPPAGHARAMARARSLNFPSRSPATRSTGMTSSPADPTAGQGARAQSAQRTGEPGRAAAQPVGVGARRHLGGRSGEHRRLRPALRELLDAEHGQLSARRSSAARRAARRRRRPARGWRRSARGAAPARPARKRRVQRDAPAHGVADQCERPRARGARDRRAPPARSTGSTRRGPPVAAEVGRDRPVALGELGDHGIPARARVCEPVQQDERRRHPPHHDRDRHLPAAARLLRRARPLRRCSTRARRPGSRSTPLVLSLAREPRIRCFSHIDERCAAFFALGAAKASGRPVAMACTSGTRRRALRAGRSSRRAGPGCPLIVLTADRPAELRDVGAGQTINQIGLYGDAVKWFVEVGVARGQPREPALDALAGLPGLLDRAGGQPRPRAPQLPAARAARARRSRCPRERAGAPGGRPWVARAARAATGGRGAAASCPRAASSWPGARSATPSWPTRSPRFAARAGYPLLADPLSGARRGPAAIAHYDLLLRDPGLPGRPGAPSSSSAPATCPPPSRCAPGWPVWARCARSRSTPRAAGRTRPAWSASAWPPIRRHAGRSRALRLARPGLAGALARGRRRGGARSIDDASSAMSCPSPRWPAACAPGWAPTRRCSWPARCRSATSRSSWPRATTPPRLLSNRGANGIDGTVSSALGAAAASAGPVVLLIGDVALAHDLGGLLAARRLGAVAHDRADQQRRRRDLSLPPRGRRRPTPSRQHVATPHGLRFELAAQLYGCGYEAVDRPRRATRARWRGRSRSAADTRSSRSPATARPTSPFTAGWRRRWPRRWTAPASR